MARLTIESIAAGGDGVGRVDGLAVFVPRTAPGDVVDVTVRAKGKFARGEIVRIVEPAPSRVSPRCRHYEGDDCGGCQLQHLVYAEQLEQKRRMVTDAMARIARRQVDVPPVEASPSPWEYRSRLTLTLRRIAGAWVVGLRSRRDASSVFHLHECPITDQRVVAAWSEIVAAADALPPAVELRGTVRLLGAELAFVLEGADLWPRARDFSRRCPSLAVVRWRPGRGLPRVISDRRSNTAPEASFDQVNQSVAVAARAHLVSRAMFHQPSTAVDAYSGLGATSASLAGYGVAVTAIEADAEAASWSATHLPGVRVLPGRVENLLAQVLPADVVILNPPRAGVDARVAEVLEAGPRPRAILYMSCDAATLARDIGRMPSWQVASIRAWDMFPQTAHVEIVCELITEDS